MDEDLPSDLRDERQLISSPAKSGLPGVLLLERLYFTFMRLR